MPELAVVLRRFGAAYRALYGDRLLPSHRAAMAAIEFCRTFALGGQVWRCDHGGCSQERYAYHSCHNRSCPKCHREQTDRWLALHRARLPACSSVLLTFTVPSELRSLARSHQEAKGWVVDAQHAGNGEKVLDSLARSVFRVAISNSQIDVIADDGVTFHHRDRRSDTVRSCTLPRLVFLARFLRHVLPKGFAKVRSYGLLAPSHRPRLDAALPQLEAASPSRTATAMSAAAPPGGLAPLQSPATTPAPLLPRCPVCHVGTMRMVRTLPPRRAPP